VGGYRFIFNPSLLRAREAPWIGFPPPPLRCPRCLDNIDGMDAGVLSVVAAQLLEIRPGPPPQWRERRDGNGDGGDGDDDGGGVGGVGGDDNHDDDDDDDDVMMMTRTRTVNMTNTTNVNIQNRVYIQTAVHCFVFGILNVSN